MTEPGTDRRLLLLAPEDNVLVARGAIGAGEAIVVEGQPVVLAAALSLGHKLARRGIAPGEGIIKYGAVIGTATAAIPAGAHVHLHNVRSNYTATHSLDAARAEAGKETP